MKKTSRNFILSIFVLLVFSGFGLAKPVVRWAAGANAADILPAVNEFRADLGALNPNVASSFPSGRREINWDAVPDFFSSPNPLPANFLTPTASVARFFQPRATAPRFSSLVRGHYFRAASYNQQEAQSN